MKQNFFKYLAIAAALLVPAMNVQAQDSGVRTAKTVKGPDDNGFYTIRLETFATGTTTVTESANPLDVVLVLDVSGSMEEPKGTPTELPRNTQITYNTVANSDVSYFYKDSDGYWNKIYPGTTTFYGTTYYYLYYDYGRGETRIGSYQTNPNSTIYTTTRNNPVETASMSKMDALKGAVKGFIDEIEKNDHQDKQGNERNERLHNRISIITFSDNANRICGLTRTEGNVATLKGYVDLFASNGGTNAGRGMSEANNVLQNANADANKVVIMFTDGAPTDDYAAIGQSNTTKNQRNAVVFTIGVFDSTPTTNGTTWRYMNYVSSNFPNATGINNPGSGGDASANYYQDASSSDADLSAIFVAIAQGIGGAAAEIGSSTQVRDVVSNSFVIPEGTQPSDIKVYTADALTETTWADAVAFNATVNIVDVDAEGKPVEEGDATATNRAVVVEGFDFSKDDTSEGAGDGNWVGQRFNRNHNPQYFWAGKKLIIEIKIKANGEATGGTGTPTNEATSGVYIKDPETGEYTCIDHYDIPHTTLSTTIKIKKTGLRIGESATFEIMKIRPKGWDDTKTLEENVANIEYNIIGQPLPNSHEYTGSETLEGSDLYKEMGWSSFSKVILTNKSETNGAEVIKVMRGLDPYWIYMVLEDDWGWAYDMTGHNQADADGLTTTSSVAVNPFTFENKEKENAVKHAEAVTINHFGYTIQTGEFQGKQEEHYKSSKTSFPTTH